MSDRINEILRTFANEYWGTQARLSDSVEQIKQAREELAKEIKKIKFRNVYSNYVGASVCGKTIERVRKKIYKVVRGNK